MVVKNVAVAPGITAGGGNGLFLIAGPCVIESADIVLGIGSRVQEIASRLGIPYIFKASFDKANRSSISSFRGPGLEDGLETLAMVKKELGVPILTDFHEPAQAATVAEVADVLQIPAFLCRQTDMLVAAAKTGACVNVKKGQFLSPWDTKNIIEKITACGNDRVVLTERGASFGYQNLVVDMKSIPIMQEMGAPVIFDATHSVQLPGGLGKTTGGMREFVPTLSRAAVAAGADGLFLEVHPEPENAKSDGTNMWPLDELEPLLEQLIRISEIVRT